MRHVGKPYMSISSLVQAPIARPPPGRACPSLLDMPFSGPAADSSDLAMRSPIYTTHSRAWFSPNGYLAGNGRNSQGSRYRLRVSSLSRLFREDAEPMTIQASESFRSASGQFLSAGSVGGGNSPPAP